MYVFAKLFCHGIIKTALNSEFTFFHNKLPYIEPSLSHYSPIVSRWTDEIMKFLSKK